MIKRICEMTEEDNSLYFQHCKEAMMRDYGTQWSEIEPKIISEIGATFDDAKFAEMDSESAIDAAYAREYFKWKEKHEKPSFICYMLWTGGFVTKSDLVEI